MRESRDSVEFALNWLNCVLRGQTIGAQDRLPGRCRRILDLVVLMCRNISVEARRRKSHSAADSTNDRSGAGVGCSKGEGKRCEGIKKKLRYEIKQSASRIKKPNGHQEAREQEHGQTEGCILEGRRLEGPKELAGESVEEIRLSADRAKLALREKKKKVGARRCHSSTGASCRGERRNSIGSHAPPQRHGRRPHAAQDGNVEHLH